MKKYILTQEFLDFINYKTSELIANGIIEFVDGIAWLNGDYNVADWIIDQYEGGERIALSDYFNGERTIQIGDQFNVYIDVTQLINLALIDRDLEQESKIFKNI